ncbi:MAG: protealysin inhibitor emfourin [Candidatus Binatia bacterium]
MIVAVKRTGGFAGLTEAVAQVDSAALAPAARQELETLVREEGGFFALPAEVPTDEVGADLFRWEITVDDASRSHTVACAGREAPADARVRRVIDAVLRLGR